MFEVTSKEICRIQPAQRSSRAATVQWCEETVWLLSETKHTTFGNHFDSQT